MEQKLLDLINTINSIKNANQFPNYIDYIQFPFFRNIELDQRINFDFPLTVFVGPNGSGKSSTLHALYGCPEGKTPYDFWFSTDVDPVVYELESRNLRHSFFYGFKNDKDEELQVVKARIRRKNNPNYWETSRPLLSYGMNHSPEGKERNEPIKKNVVYLDFRAELSAFDKYFYFETPPDYLVSKTKQEYLTFKSKFLKSLFLNETKEIKSPKGTKQNEHAIELNKEELDIISNILGKSYIEGKVIRHKLFHTWGYSILLTTKFHKYSEAFAGSGEMSVVRLAQKILNADIGCLILLDEPEVSLHPGAQARLKLFLLDQIKMKKHQVIISTHSPSMIEGLPKEAIKVFWQKEDTGKFIIKEKILYEEAFFFIGQKIGDKITIVVEDKLSEKIVKRTLEKLGPEVINRFEVRQIPGGAETIIKHYIPVYCNNNDSKHFFLLDGDKRYFDNLFDISSLRDEDKNEPFLKTKIKEQTKCEVQFYVDGNSEGGNVAQRISMMIAFLKYYKERVRYFPMITPEDIIWSEEIVKQKLHQQDYEQNIERIHSFEKSKQKIYESSKILFGIENQIDAFEDLLINEWIRKEDENYNKIKDIVTSL